MSSTRAAALVAAFLAGFASPLAAQHEGHVMAADSSARGGHEMWTAGIGGGWRVTGMAQAVPLVTFGAPFGSGALRETGWYVTQPAVMAVLASPGARFTLRTTLDFEGATIPDGELTFGGWGEGFIDKRHPHTLVHELVAGFNTSLGGGVASLSAGKMFAAYGTDDPMMRPAVKYPTNHHLSQVLERWGVTGAWLRGRTSIEASVFGGAEPDGPYDFSNISPWLDSWSARLTQRWGVRAEFSTRPEWMRLGVSETDGFFRYDHDEHATGATRWLILTAGAGWGASGAIRPFVEGQLFHTGEARGGIDPRALFGARTFTSISFGARILLGGEPMRMGAYGVLDPMVSMLRPEMDMTMHDDMRRP